MRQQGTARERQLAQSLSEARSTRGRLGLSSILFRPVTLISLVLIGFFAFGALIVLGGFANDLRKAPPGQATPRSESAVGYKVLTKYLERLDYDIAETRGKRDSYDRENRLVIYSPSNPYGRIKKSLKSQGNETKLIILPKWTVSPFMPQKGEARKMRGAGVYHEEIYQRMLDDIPVIRRKEDPSPDANPRFKSQNARLLSENYTPDFEGLQYFDLETYWPDHIKSLRERDRLRMEERRREQAEARGETYEPKTEKSDKKKPKAEDKDKEDGKDAEPEPEPEPLPNPEILLEIDGHPVLIRMEETQTYILSEPDLVNTMAFQTQGGAQLASALIDEIITTAQVDQLTVDFDVSLHGIESNRNIVKLMVTPPFLAATLCLIAAGGLVAWQGFNRFGDPARVRPDYAQGPVSLAKTAAEFMGISYGRRLCRSIAAASRQ